MFTGIVTAIGTVVELEPTAESRRLTIASDLPDRELAKGASVCCSGVCLTVVDAANHRFVVDVAFETLRRTTFDTLKLGDRLNLEPALRVGDALGGHFVTGHVDAVARVRTSMVRGPAREVWLDLPADVLKLVAPKGSLAIDGVSLTVNDVDAAGCMVGLVPHTLEVTTLGKWQPGDRINVEADMLARYVARLVEARVAGSSDAAGGRS
jgi:riboflavin synthase